MSFERRHENLPYGPLTRQDFNMLAASFHEGGGPTGSLLAVVNQRGITKLDFMRLQMIEVGVKPAEIRSDIPEISKPDLGEAGAGQTGIELPD